MIYEDGQVCESDVVIYEPFPEPSEHHETSGLES